jgi:hypothetical protein
MSVVIDSPALVVGHTTGPNPEPPAENEGGGSVSQSQTTTTFANTREQRIAQLRHEYVRAALEWIVAGSREEALLLMLDCLRAQARFSGIRSSELH